MAHVNPGPLLLGNQGAAAAPTNQSAPPNGDTPNKYTEKMKTLERNAATGLFIPDLLEARTEGATNFPRQIKLAIQREYFSLGQYFGGVLFGTAIGLLIMFIILLSGSIPGTTYSFFGESGAWSMAIFLTCFFIMLLFNRFQLRRNRVCSYKKTIPVDEDKRGMPCLQDTDCTNKPGPVKTSLCTSPPPNFLFRVMRDYVGLAGSFIGAIAAYVYAAKNEKAPTGHKAYMPIFFGFSVGTIWGYFFS